MFENSSAEHLSSLGEFGLIDHLTQGLTSYHAQTVYGIGDDAAIIDCKTQQALVSTDLLLEGIHFDLSYTPLLHLGYKAVIVNLSDICAMNAVPKQITVSLGLSSRFGLDATEELYKGIRTACEKYQIDIIGGDTCSSLKGLTISITSIGYADAAKISRRTGAKKGNLICVSGDLGAAYTGLQLLEREKQVFLSSPKVQPDLEGKDYIVQRQLRPEARTDVVQFFTDHLITPTSMIDISDGLASELLHICKGSAVGCRIYESKIPIDPMTIQTASEFGLNATVCALNGGEDYELLFTLETKHYETVLGNSEITVIGHITSEEEGAELIGLDDSVTPIRAQGWQAFNS